MAEAYSDKIIAPGLSYGGLRTHVTSSVTNVDGMTSRVNIGSYTEAIRIAEYDFTYGGWIDGANATGDQSGTANNYGSSWAVAAQVGGSRNITKGYSARSVEVWSWCRYSNGTTAVAKVYETIPARDKHTVKYNAAGGSGAPSSQTKWYGDVLTLSSTKPTRANYRFDGWKDSNTGEVRAAGSKYGLDKDVTLTAVWTLLYKAPTVTYKGGYRVASATSTAEAVMGTYARLTFAWSVDTSVYSGNTGKSFAASFKVDGSTTRTVKSISPESPSGKSGTVVVVVALATSEYGAVTLTVTDSCEKKGSSSATGVVGQAHVPLEFAKAGTSVGVLHAAPGSKDSVAVGSLTITGANSPDMRTTTMDMAMQHIAPQRRLLWSGDWAKGASKTVSGINSYILLAVQISGYDEWLPMLNRTDSQYITAGTALDDGTTSSVLKASFQKSSATSETLTLRAASSHVLDTTVGGTGRNVKAIYGLF